MTYQPPVQQILLAMQVAGRLDDAIYADLSHSDAATILNQAARFAAERIAPLNWIGDRNPAKLVDGRVVTPPGWQEVYRDWCANGWNSLTGPEAYDGQGLPFLLAAACTEMWNAGSMSFALCPLLTTGAIEAVAEHASEALKQHYLPKMISGEWSGTMNLTEPQSGSDLSQLRCKATRNDDGTYAITGNKIYITYGDHDLTQNIVHLVLARLDDAPSGTKGISLFLVPKILPDGTLNDLRCHSLEHKMGIHGSPTCAMVYGDAGGATGWLIGEENRGLACMFTMMNNARVLVGVQGVAIASRAFEAALTFAGERKQGRALSGDATSNTIINHPDIKRMLLEMRSKTSAARMLCLATASAIDGCSRAEDETTRKNLSALSSLLTPLAKSYATDIAVDVASAAVQIHGGMGFIEETGVAQYYRDARILPIYEGTNGIQAIDLVTRKLTLDNGKTLHDAIIESQAMLANLIGLAAAATLATNMNALIDDLKICDPATTLSAATPFTRSLATFIAAAYLAKAAFTARGSAIAEEAEVDAKFFIATELPTSLTAAQAAIKAASITISASFG